MMEQMLLIEEKYRPALVTVRHIAGLKAATSADGLIWLRGSFSSGKDGLLIRALPVTQNYWVDADGRLFPEGKPTPVAVLPTLDWQPLKTFLPVTLPTAALPGGLTETIRIEMAPSGLVREAFALITELSHWKTYAETAPQTRLAPLRFAASDSGKVLIIGQPLPPLPGQHLWEQQNNLLPLGLDFDPPVLAELLTQQTEAAAPSYRLFNRDGRWEQVNFSDFRPARRSAVRLTVNDHG
ncbi:hypothetical protein EOD41_02880 [Mucilaginibacter limnophilus]|uniref:MoxR-vWA-beta-propeller ternary system domain-containing protein n=1 Tax=Mucilaginibacter limnophilus TaxID=1932778 RepID=A0A3S3TK59_9SPHI|nr:hypothetical protein [Mucilaginibacter limnophilus]RVU02899.1 hypothetical protein EOD41_02880 [Mucilaginibacter limnophilus]